MSFSLYCVIRIVLLHNVILNVVKNLSERIDVGAIVEGCAIPEILCFTQDDNVEYKHPICVILNVSHSTM